MLRPTRLSWFLVASITVALLTFPIYAQAQSPQMTSVTPTSGVAGTQVTIVGTGFGAGQSTSTVTFNGTVATTITSWGATSIVVAVPTGATTGNVVVTVGGVASNNVNFTVATTNFSLTGSLATARMFHTSTLLSSGTVLLAGGVDGFAYDALSSAELYSPATGTFTTTGNLNTARIFNTATLLTNGQVLIAGGSDSNWNQIGTAELYNPASGTFTFTGALNTARTSHTATVLNSGQVLIVGGWDSNGDYITSDAAGSELYDPTAGTFGTSGNLNTARDTHTATLLNNGQVLIAGGFDSNSNVLSSAELYDPAAGTFTLTGSLNVGRAVHTATLLNNGLVLIAGGYDINGNAVASAELYDPVTGAFTVTGSMNTPRYDGAQGTLLNNGMVLLAGGQDNNGNTLASAELYDPATGIFTVTGSMNSTRQSLTTTLLNNGQVLVAAGMDFYANVLNTAELYQPSTLIASLSPLSGMVGTLVTITGTNFGATQGTSTVALNTTSAAVTSWSNTSIVVVVPAGASSGPFVVTVNGQVATSPTFSVATLLSVWADTDVGSVSQPGSATFSNGIFTVTGAGGGIGGTADGMHFVHQPLVGDGSIVARVTSVQNGAAGVMIRETLNPSAADASVYYWDDQTDMQDRPTTGATAVTQNTNGYAIPEWLELVRVGNTFTSFASPDGVNWTQVGTSTTVPMAQNVYVGLAVSSGNYPGNGWSLATATFDSVSINSSAAPAPVITGLSPTTASVGSQVTITGNNFGAAQSGSVLLLSGTPTTVNLWSNTSIMFTIPVGATSGQLLVSVAPSMNDSNPVYLEVTTQPLPTAWLDQDVGIVSQIGSATFSNGIFTVSGAGGGIGGTADGMHFVYQPLVGDGSIVARVTSVQNGAAGVMIRETLNPSAADATVYYWDDQTDVQDRPTTGATAVTQNTNGYAIPEWLELVRVGNTFTSFASPDGVGWTQVGTSTTVPMAQNVYVSLVVSSGNYPGNGWSLATATFDSVSINSSAVPAPVITGLSPTTASVGSQVTITGNNFGAAQGGSELLLSGTPITINSWSNTSIMFTIPVGATSGPLMVSVAPSMNDSNPVYLEVTTQPLPTSWLNQDVGAVTQAGSATFSGGVFTVTGGGSGFGGTADAMQFVYQPLVGDGAIVARLLSLEGEAAGVMIRETLSPSSADAYAWFWPNQAFLLYRPTTGASAVSQSASFDGEYPYWLQLIRTGNTFTEYASLDGVNWTQIGASVTIPMAQTVYIGLAVSGGGSLTTATFDNVRVTVGTTPLVSGLSPIAGTLGTPVTVAGSNFGATQGASTVQFNGALATSIASWSSSQIVVAVPVGVPNGTGPVVVTVNSIPSPITASVQFTVYNPVITSLEPSAGPLNGTFTINGSGFGAIYSGYVDGVLINGVSVPIASCPNQQPCWTDTQIQALIPSTVFGSAPVTFPSTFPVAVNNVGYVSNSLPFTITAPPAIVGISPATGVVGTPVTITGTGFGPSQSDNIVAFGGVDAGTATSWSDTGAPGGAQIVINVPENAITGPVTVTIAGITVQGPTFTLDTVATLTASNGAQTTYTSTQVGGTWSMYNSQGPGCSSCSVRGNVQNTFDSIGNLLTGTDANGNTVTYTYDGNNNVASRTAQLNGSPVTTSYTYNNFAEVLTMTDPLGNTTTNTYDGNGNLLTVSSPAPNGRTPSSVTQFTYNNLGELTQILDPLNHPTTMTYTAAGQIGTITDAQNSTTSYTYDARGNRTSVIDPINGAAHPTTFTYDIMNRLTGITYPNGASASFGYDYRGRRTSATDQNNKTTLYAYDDADRLISVTDPANNVTQYNYDTENNLVSITDANNHTTYFAYDTMGRVIQTNFPSSLTETYTYDQLYNLTSKTDRKNQTIQYVYDALYRMINKTYPDETSANYVYDLVGKIQQVTDPTGTYAFAYDNMGRLIGTSTQYSFLPGFNFQNSYTYDAASNRTSLTAPDGSTNTYQYDTLNRLATLTNSLTGQFGFGYDALSRRTQLTRPNGINTNYSYDSLSHLLSVLHQSGMNTLDGVSYTYDPAGNRTSKGNYLNGVTSNYTYDQLYELTQVTQGGSATESYSYDAVGNRLSSLGVPIYSYNSSNELISNSSGSYTYDANGNTLSDPSGKSYSWDFENRMTQAVVPGTGTVNFKYDPFGRRIYKSSPTFTGIFVYDADNLLETLNASGAEVASYTQTQKIDETLAELRNNTTDYYEADGLGSITSLSTSTAALANTYAYDSFGDTTNFTGTLRNPFQYTGREWDAETSLYFNRARYFDPTSGRFISEDPIGFRGGIDFYDYVFNNPLLWSDARGLQVEMCSKFWHPHTFICVDGDCSGKYPGGNNIWDDIWSPGQIQNDSANKSKAHCGKVPNSTPCFEQCVTKYIRRRGPSGDIYDFMLANCGQWAEDIVTECRTQCSK